MPVFGGSLQSAGSSPKAGVLLPRPPPSPQTRSPHDDDDVDVSVGSLASMSCDPTAASGLQFRHVPPLTRRPEESLSAEDGSTDALAMNVEPEERKKKKLHFAGWSDDSALADAGAATMAPDTHHTPLGVPKSDRRASIAT